jgi:hypothetical protein
VTTVTDTSLPTENELTGMGDTPYVLNGGRGVAADDDRLASLDVNQEEIVDG